MHSDTGTHARDELGGSMGAKPGLGNGAATVQRRQLDRDLRRAVSQGDLVVHYQPRWSLTTGAITGAEALLRWPDRRRGLVPPSEFIPAAERSGLIHSLGRWVLRDACTEAAHWPNLSVSVNLSARQLREGALLDQIGDALSESDLPPERLELEFNEEVLLESGTDLLLTLSTLRDLGVGIAVDDFGSGCGSLSMLKRLPLTTMKIDRSLARELPRSYEETSIVRAAIEAGHGMGLTTVAAGIETEAQRALLSGLGCNEGQGYLFSRPVPPAILRTLFPA